MRTRKTIAISAAVLAAVAGLTACGGGDSSDTGSADPDAKVEMTFWHNSTTGDGKQYWDDAVKAYEDANPNVTITVQAIQNEDMDGKLQTALNSGDAPDIFMARGGGKLADVVKAGQVMDLTDKISADVKSDLGDGIYTGLTVDGKIYGAPVSLLPGGIFYSKDLFEKAGISSTPTTLTELSDAVDKLKAAGIEPIALGAKDAWPAAHWFYFFSLRECSQDTVEATAKSRTFDDPCWLRAATDLKDFADTEPFNTGFLTTSAQQGAGSSAGMLANHQAAMELMGAWDPGVIASLTPDEKPLPDLGWFPFPSVDGGKGDPDAMMAGVDGYACYKDAPAQCADFLNFISSKEWQEKYATAFNTLPAAKSAQGVVEENSLKDILAAYNKAPYVELWLDTQFGQNIGNAMNTGVVNMLAGQGSPDDIITATNDAAKKS